MIVHIHEYLTYIDDFDEENGKEIDDNCAIEAFSSEAFTFDDFFVFFLKPCCKSNTSSLVWNLTCFFSNSISLICRYFLIHWNPRDATFSANYHTHFLGIK